MCKAFGNSTQVFATKYVHMNYWIFSLGYNGNSTIIINYKRRKLIRTGLCLLQLKTFSDSPVVMYISCLGLIK